MSCKDRLIESEISKAEILFGDGQEREAFNAVVEALRNQVDLRYHYAEVFIPLALKGKIAEIEQQMKQGKKSDE